MGGRRAGGNLDLRAIFRLERSGLHAGLRPAASKYLCKIKWLLSVFQASGLQTYHPTNE